jgi:hypothetical protein
MYTRHIHGVDGQKIETAAMYLHPLTLFQSMNGRSCINCRNPHYISANREGEIRQRGPRKQENKSTSTDSANGFDHAANGSARIWHLSRHCSEFVVNVACYGGLWTSNRASPVPDNPSITYQSLLHRLISPFGFEN